MSRGRFIQADRLALIQGGSQELRARLSDRDPELLKSQALVIREPSLPGAPYYLVTESSERERLLRYLRRRSRSRTRAVTVLIGIEPSELLESQDYYAERGIVFSQGLLVGAWAPERSVPDTRATPIAATKRFVSMASGLLQNVRAGRQYSRYAPQYARYVPPAAETIAPSAGVAGAAAAPEAAALQPSSPPPKGPPPSHGDAPPPSDPPQPSRPRRRAGANDASASLLRRTPHMKAPDPLPTRPQSEFKVSVWTNEAPVHAGEEAEDVLVEAPPDVREVELGVLLIAGPHLEVRGDCFKTLKIVRDETDSSPVVFDVAIAADASRSEEAELIAQFYYRGRPSGRVRRRWRWPSGEVVLVQEGQGGVPIHTDSSEHDMVVLITSISGGGFSCSLHAKDVPGYKTPTPSDNWSPGGEAEKIVKRALAKLVDRAEPSDDRRLALLEAGRTFWDAAPPVFRKALWALIDERRKQGETARATIYIASDEPLMPWEVMRPSRHRIDAPDEDLGLPLGAEFAVGRWVRGEATSPPQALPVSDSFLIAPKYDTDEEVLDFSREWSILKKHFGGRQVKPCSSEALDDYLASHAASLLHFACHGAEVSDGSVIYLDGFRKYSSGALRESQGFKAACEKKAPIVFLNACDAGKVLPTLGPGSTGFPVAFSALGARAILAPVWPVTKTNAPVVAQEIYQAAVDHPERSLGDVLAELRARSYREKPFDDSWAAYCLFGDPLTRLRPEV